MLVISPQIRKYSSTHASVWLFGKGAKTCWLSGSSGLQMSIVEEKERERRERLFCIAQYCKRDFFF